MVEIVEITRGGNRCGSVKRGGGMIPYNEGIGGINDVRTALVSSRLLGGKKPTKRKKTTKRKTCKRKK